MPLVDRFAPSRAPAAAREGNAAPPGIRGSLADAGVPEVAAGLAGVAIAPAAVVALRLFDPLLLAGSAAPWLPSLTAAAATALAAVAMLVGVARGLRDGSPPAVLRGGAMGAVATGLAVAAVEGASSPGAFPVPALSACAVAAGVLLAAASLAPARTRWSRERLVIGAVITFVLLEATLAVALFVEPSHTLAAWLLAVGAGLAAVSAVPGPWMAAGLAAAGFAALAAARVGSLETLAGVLALAAAAVAYATGERPVRQLRQPAPPAPEPRPLVPILPPEAAAEAAEPGDDATRLARELRGTIAELLQARRTVELQRDEILRLETQDGLTGVASRRAILERLRIEAAEARRYGHPVAVVLLDIDGFTALNHDRGMGVADDLLREVALRLRLRTRSADALGRVGADSFLLLLPHTDETGAATFASALLERLLARPVETHGGEVRPAVSIGVAFMRPGMSLTDAELLAEAEAALASARAAGGNRIAFDRMHGLLRIDDRQHAQTEGDRPDAGRAG